MRPLNARVLNEGKTKVIYEVPGYPNIVLVENKDNITKNDDPTATRVMAAKGEIATETTSIIFELLRQAGLPVAYEQQIDSNSFQAKKCRMLPLEIIIRWVPEGSVLKRYPEIVNEIGPRFPAPWVEFFLKTTNGRIVSFEGASLGVLPIDPKTNRPFEDPFIYGPNEKRWMLKNPKVPIDAKESTLCIIEAKQVLPSEIKIEAIKPIAEKLGNVLRDIFRSIGLDLIDLKFEMGVDANGEVLIADVLDNDSWRLRTMDGRELSKELFRQNAAMETVQEAYEFVVTKLRTIRPTKI
jgi:phosphoribosylaminoimidazole-succinocarboxamide synthase